MPQFPTLRFPRLTAPASLDPRSILAAQGANERELLNTLVREPLGALGLAVPDVPAPGEVGARMLGELPAPPGFPGAKLEVGDTARNANNKPPAPAVKYKVG